MTVYTPGRCDMRRLFDWLLSLSPFLCGDLDCTICGPTLERIRKRRAS